MYIKPIAQNTSFGSKIRYENRTLEPNTKDEDLNRLIKRLERNGKENVYNIVPNGIHDFDELGNWILGHKVVEQNGELVAGHEMTGSYITTEQFLKLCTQKCIDFENKVVYESFGED